MGICAGMQLFATTGYAEKKTEETETGAKRDYFEWQDEVTGAPIKLYYTWIPEVWRGTKLAEKVYVKIEPMEEYKQVTPKNKYDISLPIIGRIFNSRNAPFISIIDRAMPWYKIYLIMMIKYMD